MAQNTVAAGRAWLYSHNIGRNAVAGMGFSLPISVACADDGVLYVANRGNEQNPGGIRLSKLTVDQEFINEFGRTGLAYGSEGSKEGPLFKILTGVAVDADGNIYATDEWYNRVTIFNPEGEVIGQWGEAGEEDGKFNGSGGICFDADGHVWIVNTFDSKVQKFSKDGKYISGFGVKGSGDGEMEMPYGIAIDDNGDIYIADWGNDRCLKFDPSGNHLLTFGGPSGPGSLKNPTGVCVDGDGDVYVVDWMHERVVIYDVDSKPLSYLYGDALEVSKWGQMSIDANPDMNKARRRVQNLEEQQRRFRMPTGCAFDRDNNRLIICDTQRGRLQIYEKDNSYLDPQVNL
ncbi:MAG: hypothetical protein FI721_04710 [SAR202 cluster bacterium]|nr:hypothetical protein [SAR202 cluster bacterium]MQG36034.1 hypothetical protein [SAR202 cluster bacterium]MQG87028.1 hypothetical protein [SAR202 cluster bacterium]|tara:strand:- start:34390 stop:35427 length:1038 start_codon:yes stop_codon:yes gene_type:complete